MTMIVLLILILLCSPAWADDWPNWRGPQRDGISTETDLPDTWSKEGENLAWKAPYGGRSGPIILGNHLYLLHDGTLKKVSATKWGNTSNEDNLMVITTQDIDPQAMIVSRYVPFAQDGLMVISDDS